MFGQQAQKQLQQLRTEKVRLDKKAALAIQTAKLYSDSSQHAKGGLAKASSTRQLQNVRLQEATGVLRCCARVLWLTVLV